MDYSGAPVTDDELALYPVAGLGTGEPAPLPAFNPGPYRPPRSIHGPRLGAQVAEGSARGTWWDVSHWSVLIGETLGSL